MVIPDEQMQPVMLTVQNAVKRSAFSRTRLYAEMKSGRLDVRKAGRRTLITRESLDALLAALPKVA